MSLLLDLLLDVLFVTPGDHLARRLAGAEAGQRRMLLKFLQHGIKGRVHVLRLDFHTHQFLAGGQIFNSHVHNRTFQLSPPRPRNANGSAKGRAGYLRQPRPHRQARRNSKLRPRGRRCGRQSLPAPGLANLRPVGQILPNSPGRMSANENNAYKRAQELAAVSKDEAALIAFEEAIRQQSDNYKAAFGAGLMLQRLNRHSEAVARFSSVIKTHPGLAEAYYSRALSCQGLQKHLQALTDIEHALVIRADFADARCAQGHSLKALGRHPEAVQAYSAAIALSPLHLPALHGRAIVKRMLRDNEGAVADLGVCIANGGTLYDVRLLRGLAFADLAGSGCHRRSLPRHLPPPGGGLDIHPAVAIVYGLGR